MTALENLWVELYMAAMVFILYILGCRGKKERNTSAWYYKYCLIIQISVLLSDVFIWFFEFRGEGIFWVYCLLWGVNFILFIALILSFSLYIYAYIKENYKVEVRFPVHYFCFISFITIFLWILSFWNKSIFVLNTKFYPEYTNLFSLVVILIILLLLPSFYVVIVARKKMERRMRILFSIYSLLPIVAMFIEYLTEINCIFYSSTALLILLVYVGINQKNRLIAYNQSVELQAKESEMKETEQKVMMGNIQPLFIQTVLASIADMAEKDPKRAESTTSSFATYLTIVPCEFF